MPVRPAVWRVTLELLGAVIIPTYIIVPLGGGSIANYFYLGCGCIVIASILCFLMARTCGVYAKKIKIKKEKRLC